MERKLLRTSRDLGPSELRRRAVSPRRRLLALRYDGRFGGRGDSCEYRRLSPRNVPFSEEARGEGWIRRLPLK